MHLKKIRLIVAFAAVFLTVNSANRCYAKAENYDSLLSVANQSSSDHEKARIYNEIARSVIYSNPDTALILAKQAISYAKLISELYVTMGVAYRCLGNYPQGIEALKKARHHGEKASDKRSVESANSSLGLVYQEQGNYSAAIEIYLEILLSAKNSNDTNRIAQVSNNIGNIYFGQELYEKALVYYKEAYQCALAMQHKFGQGLLLNNLGSVYFQQKKYDLAIEHFNQSFEISQELNDQEGIGICYLNISSVLTDQNNYKQALIYQEKALSIKQALHDLHGESLVLNEIGKTYQDLGNLKKGIELSEKGLAIATKIGSPALEQESHRTLYVMYEELGNATKAYQNYKSYIELRDSLINEESKEKDLRNELSFEYKKQHYLDSLQQAKKEAIAEHQINAQQAEIKAQKTKQYALYGGIVLVLVFSAFMYNRFKITQKQKLIIEETNEELNQTNEEILAQRDEIERQKNIVEEKNIEITESITYARRIQTAILPPIPLISKHLSSFFVLYQPKDIVAGDFYWFETTDTRLFLAAADCTGHGVPGAMVSVVCHNALNRAVREFGLEKPSEILDKVRELVLSTFEMSEEQVKDGMDISLICFYKDSKIIEWAGANNPLYIIRSESATSSDRVSSSDTEGFAILKGDREPIGYTKDSTPFTNHQIQLNKGDVFYLFSDGYADQFGGPKGKKFGYKQFRNMLMENHQKPMEEQKNIFLKEFNQWITQGNDEQVDDVCVIGVRL